MVYNPGKRGQHAYLISSWRPRKKTHYLRYDLFESAFLGFLGDLDWKAIAPIFGTK
jgi:hypothetical protein